MELNPDTDVIIKNKGLLTNTENIVEKKKTLREKLRKISMFIDQRRPEENLYAKISKLNEYIIPEQEVDEKVLGIKRDIVEYFRKVADIEGITSEHTNLDFRLIFVNPDYLNAGIRGLYNPADNYILIAYSGVNDQRDLLEVSVSIFHEIRHAVSRRIGFVTVGDQSTKGFLGDIPYSDFEINSGMRSMGVNPDSNLLEEIYVIGFTQEMLHNVDNRDIQDGIDFVKTRLVEQNKQPDLYTTLTRKGDSNRYFYTGYTELLLMYQYINLRIPNFANLCSNVRSGKTGARNTLSRELIKHFGREVLKTMLTCRVSESDLVFDKITQL